MRKTSMFFLLLTIILFSQYIYAAQKSEQDRVRSMIELVNNAWQENNSAKVSAFWDNAAYHTGNMEAYRLTGKEEYLDYSLEWAEYNEWEGAKCKDKYEWKLNYGETDEYVLFGDWQICFQVYAELYNISPDEKKIKRAREVMEYEMSTDRNDYWWWADGLYMVMPVMTRLYKITNNRQYLDKLYEYIQYTDSIMYDKEEKLYYRDAKYVYPSHKTMSEKKDFWSRGNGWVLAGLARVLQDLPKDWDHYSYFKDKFCNMAESVKQCQQREGWWTRSLLDVAQAPGCETSGTAFFTYGLLWGINNGLLSKDEYIPTVEKSWKYLSNTALQKDGSIGYVQPIGERAKPGQVVDKHSSANFGVGAFLLAATEYVRFLESKIESNVSITSSTDRQFWVNSIYRIAEPILKPMAEDNLKQTMLTETSPTWDGRDERVIYMEAFGRLMAGLSPWLSLEDDNTQEGVQRKQLREWALSAYKNAVDPEANDYLLWRKEGQPLVDAAYIAESFLRGWNALWLPLDDKTKQRYIEEFSLLRRVDPPYTNWLLFSATIEAFLCKAGAQFDEYRINSAIRKTEEWYTGDGWYSDGPEFAFDYYNSYVFHPMYLDVLSTMAESGIHTRIDYKAYYERALRRTQRYCIILERFISPEGTFPVFGRSSTYRLAAMQPLAMMSWQQKLPSGLQNGQVRAALTAVLHRMFDDKRNFNEGGYLTIGFNGKQPEIADWYTNNGSLYMTSLVFLPLGLPAAHPFWTDAPLPWTSIKIWSGQPFQKDYRWDDEIETHDLF